MKQFAASGDLVTPQVQGLVDANPFLAHLRHNVIVNRTSYHSNHKVTLLSGGGSGHEPTHGGFIGEGLLDAVAVGQIFASPSAVQLGHALDAISSDKGTLIIVKNYTGDVLHFGLAAEKAKADGRKVKMVIVGDDVAVSREQGRLVGRRGLAGVVLVHKVAGAASAAGKDLDTVAKYAEQTIANLATIAASLEHCIVPGKKFETELKDNEYEIGMGIHNEPGVFRKSPLPSIPDLVDNLLPFILNKDDKERAFVPFDAGDNVVLLINNMGGLSPFEINYVTSVAVDRVKQHKLKPVRIFSGTFTTAFNGDGFSITLLNLTKAGDEILDLLDAPARATGWTAAATPEEWEKAKVIDEGETKGFDLSKKSDVKLPADFKKDLERGLRALIKAEPQITRYDTVAGDGDCGETLKAGADALLNSFKDKEIDLNDAVLALVEISDVVGEAMGGTSGGLYSIFITAFAQQVKDADPKTLDVPAATKAAKGALEQLFKYTKARVGDRTLVDALDPFVNNLDKGLDAAIKAAEKGAEGTAKLRARAGRAAYVEQDTLAEEDVPDPGAYGLVQLLKAWCGVD